MEALVTFEQIQSAFILLLEMCAAVAIIWSALKIVREVRKPRIDMERRIEEHERMLRDDNKRLDELAETSALQAKLLLQIAQHLVYGDHVDDLKKAADEMRDYLIER